MVCSLPTPAFAEISRTAPCSCSNQSDDALSDGSAINGSAINPRIAARKTIRSLRLTLSILAFTLCGNFAYNIGQGNTLNSTRRSKFEFAS